MIRRAPDRIRPDNGPEKSASTDRGWLGRVGTRTLFIEPGLPRESGCIECFNVWPRDEQLNWDVFYTLLEVSVLPEQYRQTSNHVRPHSSLDHLPPEPAPALAADPLAVPTGPTKQVVPRPEAGHIPIFRRAADHGPHPEQDHQPTRTATLQRGQPRFPMKQTDSKDAPCFTPPAVQPPQYTSAYGGSRVEESA